jgi:hypothetical protein
MPVNIEKTYDSWFVKYTLAGPEKEVEAKAADLMQEWPTPGYGTNIVYRGWKGADRVLVVSRSRSCD